jgi:hypothetical protein
VDLGWEQILEKSIAVNLLKKNKSIFFYAEYNA